MTTKFLKHVAVYLYNITELVVFAVINDYSVIYTTQQDVQDKKQDNFLANWTPVFLSYRMCSVSLILSFHKEDIINFRS